MNIEELKRAARHGNWGAVDRELPHAVKSPSFVEWIKEGVESNREYLRDLAASSLALISISPHEKRAICSRLYTCMNLHPKEYSSFRAACALAVHDPVQYRIDIIPVLERWKNDDEVGSLAVKSLSSLNAA